MTLDNTLVSGPGSTAMKVVTHLPPVMTGSYPLIVMPPPPVEGKVGRRSGQLSKLSSAAALGAANARPAIKQATTARMIAPPLPQFGRGAIRRGRRFGSGRGCEAEVRQAHGELGPECPFGAL